MKVMRLLFLSLLILLVVGCASQSSGQNPNATATIAITPTLPDPEVFVTFSPDPKTIVEKFLAGWKKDDYPAIYPLITKKDQADNSLEDFSKRYQDTMDALTLSELTYSITPGDITDSTAVINFHIDFQTILAGKIQRDYQANLILDNGYWRIKWDDGLVLPDLKGGNQLKMDFTAPSRGEIFDNENKPIVTQTEVMALGIIPNQVDYNTEHAMLDELFHLTDIYPGTIKAMYDNKRDTDWYLAIGEAALSDINRLAGFGGIVMAQYNSRFYYHGGIAPQSVGYVAPLPREQLGSFLRRGYAFNQRTGQTGIEKWAEQYLGGKTGGTLYLVDKNGKVISQFAATRQVKASSVTLTLNRNLQEQAQKAMVDFRGSIVVIERNTGRILAMASSPKYDPNLFDPNNSNGGYILGNLLNDPYTPMLDRAAHGLYPLGSVFKVITFSAALESGTYTPDTQYECGYDFTELGDRTLHDWTWDHFQDELRTTGEGHTQPSGTLDLTGALMRSCNPYFWHIGLDLYNQGRVTAIADMARGFGLGSETGIAQVDEASGTIDNPPSLLDAVNQAIGQGDVLVTPLQVADFMAAIGNGGTLYRPQLVEKITGPNGLDVITFKPEARGVLPIKPETLSALRNAMLQVIRNKRGTAYPRFNNMSIPIYGKTGTAQNSTNTPHAWFAGYTDANNPAKPDIAIAVIAENGGEGSVIAAPMFKRIVETYFFGQPISPFWWEASIGVTQTPTPPPTETPIP